MIDVHRVLLSEKMLSLREKDVNEFKNKVALYLKKGYPNYKPIKVRGSYVHCIVEK